MGDLSKNFSSNEFACRHGVSNPHKRLVTALQQYRELLGVPIKITSACRCPECREKGDTPHFATADHPSLAADCIALGPTLLDMYWAALEIADFMGGGIGVYPRNKAPLKGFLHLDVRPWRARWSRLNGIYKTHQEGMTFIHDTLAAKGAEVELVDSVQPGNVSWLTDKVYHVPRMIEPDEGDED